MNLRLRPLESTDTETWDAFCGVAYQATFLHSQRFLSYHGDRFQDCSVIIEEEGRWVGVFPVALHPGDNRCLVSHPGITYGGIVHQGALRGERMVAAVSEACHYYAERGYAKLIYKAVPCFYHSTPSQDDIYALFRLDARRIRCDLTSTIDLQRRLPLSERRRRSLKRAHQAGTEIREGSEYLPAFWEVVTDNLQRKHQTSPVHSLAEVTTLAERFPRNIRCVVGCLADKVVAGVLIFATPVADHAQYIGSSDIGYEISALDAVFERCIATATSEGKRWFDFGISTEKNGSVLNEGLYRFKSEFGGGGMVQEFFAIDLVGRQNVA
jgi:Acetyltransferase (GNAT) domain